MCVASALPLYLFSLSLSASSSRSKLLSLTARVKLQHEQLTLASESEKVESKRADIDMMNRFARCVQFLFFLHSSIPFNAHVVHFKSTKSHYIRYILTQTLLSILTCSLSLFIFSLHLCIWHPIASHVFPFLFLVTGWVVWWPAI